jgi:hypothetical protein
VRVHRRLTLVLVGLLLAAGACSSDPETTWVWPGGNAQAQTGPSAAPSASATPSASAVPGGPLSGPVIVNQSRSGPGERRLAVETDGSWVCDNCAGDGKNATGRLNAAQMKQLRDFLADPVFKEEDGVPPSSPQCGDKLESNLITSSGVVLWSNCRGGGPPAVTLKILRLLADATPLDAGLPA